jgi:hypothetical protein
LETAIEKCQVAFKGTLIEQIADFSVNLTGKGEWNDIFKVLKGLEVWVK